jgi:hypothetical protein
MTKDHGAQRSLLPDGLTSSLNCSLKNTSATEEDAQVAAKTAKRENFIVHKLVQTGERVTAGKV